MTTRFGADLIRQTGHCLVFSPTALVAKSELIASDFDRLALHDSGTAQPSHGWGPDANGRTSWKAVPARSDWAPMSMKRPSSWDTPQETNSSGNGRGTDPVKVGAGDTNGWGGAHVNDDIDDRASSSGHTDFQDPDDEPSRPVSQAGIRIKVETGLPTPIDSAKQASPVEGKSAGRIGSSEESPGKGKGPDVDDAKREVEHLGRGYLMVKTRRRVTVDGGRSLLAIENDTVESQGT